MARKSRDFGHMMASQLDDSFCIVDDFAEHCDEHCDPLVGFGCPSVRDLPPYLTRIEYQLRREVLKGFGIDSLRDLRDCEASLVEYSVVKRNRTGQIENVKSVAGRGISLIGSMQ